jgi:hypothetical protein
MEMAQLILGALAQFSNETTFSFPSLFPLRIHAPTDVKDTQSVLLSDIKRDRLGCTCEIKIEPLPNRFQTANIDALRAS